VADRANLHSSPSSREARIIVGAAVIDDVLGLVILGIVAGIITAANAGGPMPYATVGLILVKASAFLIGAVVLGGYLSPRLFQLASRLDGQGVLLTMALASCFGMAYLSATTMVTPPALKWSLNPSFMVVARPEDGADSPSQLDVPPSTSDSPSGDRDDRQLASAATQEMPPFGGGMLFKIPTAGNAGSRTKRGVRIPAMAKWLNSNP
jgi:hypothetical protein